MWYSTAIMTKADFVWTVGYQGEMAIVNKTQKRNLGDAPFRQLLEKGYWRAAFCSAFWDAQKGNAGELEGLLEELGLRLGKQLALEDAQRLFGVYALPDNSVKTLAY